MKLVADGLNFPEGPVYMADGSVIVCELRSATIARIEIDGRVERIVETGGSPNGLAFGPDGRLYVCQNGGVAGWSETDGLVVPGKGLGRGANAGPDYVGGSIQVVDLESGSVEELYTHCADHRLRSPNDLVFDRHGGFWFTDSGKRRERDQWNGGLYYAKADGSEIVEAANPVVTGNGVGLSPGEERVFVSETLTGRTWEWDLVGPGQLGEGDGPGPNGARLLHALGGYELQDSLAVEAGGNVCVTIVNGGEIVVIGGDGELVERVPVAADDPHVTNLCFGGEELRTAFVTSAGRGRLYAADWPRPGLALDPGGTAPGVA